MGRVLIDTARRARGFWPCSAILKSRDLHEVSWIFLREGPCNQGASWMVYDSGVPSYDFLNVYGMFKTRLRSGST
jgi:hypothetical protein